MIKPIAAALIGLFLSYSAAFAELPTVAVITTGGTIVQKIDPKTGGAVPTVSGHDLVATVTDLHKLADIEAVNIDSSQMTPAIWARISRRLDRMLSREDVRGAVVTHGTDTMPEGAYFMDVTLKSDKPVVFTGAMNNASSANPDGPQNILNAVQQVVSSNARGWGVTVTLNSYINSARDVRKTQTTNVQTFESGEAGYLGYIFAGEVQRFNDRPWRVRVHLPSNEKQALPDVPYIATYAGADGRFVRHAVDSGAQGLVVDAVGAGNVNRDVYKAIEYALSKNIPVVITSQVYYGAVEPVYGDAGGGKTLLDKGCILGGDLAGAKARLLLMLGIAAHGNDQAQLKKLFEQE